MLVYLIALFQALMYLAAVPVCAAFCLSAGDGVRLGVGVSVFERRFALRRARRFDAFPPKKPKRRGGKRAWGVLRNLRGLGVGLRGRLCLGDAAATALACGALRALAAALGTRARRVEIDIDPEFSSAEFRVELQGMIRVRAGQIITAAARSGFDKINRRVAQWTSTPSKES